RRDGSRLAVAFIDLDHFKLVNDTLGHEAGDRLLKTVAQRMSTCLREVDTLARFGGDEFVLLLNNFHSPDEATKVLERILHKVSLPISLRKHEVVVSCSAGCSVFPDDGGDAETLLRFADVAMYRAKETGRNCLEMYKDELRVRRERRMTIETQLRHALEKKEFELYFQPQIELGSGRIVSVEALLRWHRPVLGSIAPSRFMPV